MNQTLTAADQCLHGGRFFEAIGERFDRLDRRRDIINADVLDAWFPPAPGAIAALQAHLPWICATSPPTHASGLREQIAEARGLHPNNVLLGAGSSALIFLAFREWLRRDSRVLITDPTYAEFAHVAESVIGCTVDRLLLRSSDRFQIDLDKWVATARDGYDLVVLANPNNPTGEYLDQTIARTAIASLPSQTIVWIDEAYLEYSGGESLERLAASSENAVVCKSMSKVYALSGLRAAYLCGPTPLLGPLSRLTPPWAISLPAQVAAVQALQSRTYYARRYEETRRLRKDLTRDLESAGFTALTDSAINAVLVASPQGAPASREVVERSRERGLFIRDAGSISSQFADRALRIAVKDAETNERIVDTLRWAAR